MQEIKDKFYVAPKDETLKDVAVKTGISYAKLLIYNPHYKNGVPNGAKVVLEIVHPGQKDDASQDQEETKKEENKNNDDKNSLKTDDQKEAVEVTPKEEASYTKEDYQKDLAKINSEYSQKEKKLAESFKKSKGKTEEDFAKQKIHASSIAQQERARQGREFFVQRENLKSEYDEKTLKLAQKLGQLNKKI